MRLKKTLQVSIVILFLICFGCKKTPQPTIGLLIPPGVVVVADTIIYDILLRVFDTTDIWDIAYHKHVKQEIFADYIFDGIYDGQFNAFDFYTGEALSKNDIKKIEAGEEFSRKKVTKVQIKDLWLIDSCGQFQRIPHSFTLGLEHYSSQNTFIGHKALFIVKPNPSEPK